MKIMEHHNNNYLISVLLGIGGGLTQYFIKLNEAPFMSKLFEAVITAFVCGIVGAAGKHLYDSIIKKKK